MSGLRSRTGLQHGHDQSSELQALHRATPTVRAAGAPCHVPSAHVLSTIPEGTVKGESAIATRSRNPEIISSRPTANGGLLTPLAGLLLTPLDDGRLPAFPQSEGGTKKRGEARENLGGS